MKNLTICLILLFSTPFLNAQQWVSLFNGKDLDGWTNNGTEKWWAEKGELICESGPNKQYGYLSTNKHYKNFTLSLEFKQEANGNSGVFFRSSIDGVKISGWQAEVAPPNQHTGGIYESYGRGWLILPKPEDEKVLKYGDWNKYVIRVNGDSVSTWLNDHLMISLKDEVMGKGEGFIALQIHEGGGIRVRWRNIRIQEIK